MLLQVGDYAHNMQTQMLLTTCPAAIWWVSLARRRRCRRKSCRHQRRMKTMHRVAFPHSRDLHGIPSFPRPVHRDYEVQVRNVRFSPSIRYHGPNSASPWSGRPCGYSIDIKREHNSGGEANGRSSTIKLKPLRCAPPNNT